MGKKPYVHAHITMFLLLCGIQFLAGQSLLDKEINFKTQQTSIPDALFLLSEQTNLTISFDSAIFPKNKKISINETASIESILSQCLKDYHIQYELDGKTILLQAKQRIKLTLSGYIEDASTGEKLIGANVYHPKSGKGTSSNEYGFFSLTLLEGNYNIEFSYLGYQIESQSIVLDKNQRLKIRMKPSLTLAEIVVVASSKEASSLHKNMNSESLTKLNPSKNTAAVSLGGELDILQHTYALAGVETGPDGFGGMHVRGGEVGQNLTLMDGVPVYNPSHTLGLISIFNANTVNHASFLKGGFDAKYGGRISSVLDVRTKEGNNQRFAGELRLGLLSSSLSFEGPIVKDKASFFLSARRSFIKPWISLYTILADEFPSINYNFQDFNAKINGKISKKDQLYFSFYMGGDVFLNEDNFVENSFTEDGNTFEVTDNFTQRLTWGNLISSLRWNHQYGPKLFSNLTATYSRYKYDNFSGTTFTSLAIETEEENNSDAYLEVQSNIIERTIKLDYDYSLSPTHHLTFGGSFQHRGFDSGILYADDFESELDSAEAFLEELFEENYYNANEFALYVQDEIDLQKLSLKLGIRSTGFKTEDKTYYALEPRFSIAYRFNPKIEWNASATYMTQYVHLLSSFGAGLPNDIWAPSTDFIKPQRSWQFTMGTHWKITKGLSFHSEFYYKNMNQLIAYGEGIIGPQLTEVNPEDWEEEIVQGTGESYGWENTLRQKSSRYSLGLNYTLSKSTRTFAALNQGQAFPFSFDQRHAINTFVNYKISDKIHLSSTWEFGSGRPITLIRSAEGNFLFGENFQEVETLSSKNEYRLSPNHKLNIGFDFYFRKKWGGHQFSLGTYNTYNRQNTLYEYYVTDFENSQNSSLRKVSLLPILPTISYRIFFE